MDEKTVFLEETDSKKNIREDQFRRAVNLASDVIKRIGSPLKLGEYFFNVATNREEPVDVQGILELFARDTFDEELAKAQREGARRLEELATEEAQVRSLDGLLLKGHIVRARRQRRVILAFHGWRSSWKKSYGMMADFFKDNGFTVVYIEQRAHGLSQGDHMTFGVYERFDCISWIEWARKHFGRYVPTYIMGISMGASTVLLSCGQKLPPNVKGCIADCGFTSVDEIWKHVISDCLHLIYPANAMRSLCRERLHFDPSMHTTLEAMEKSKIPVLFIHGEEDHFVPMEMTLRNFEACASDKMIMLSPKAEHGLSYYNEPERYQDYILRFVDKYH